jgi:hypothetical protein
MHARTHARMHTSMYVCMYVCMYGLCMFIHVLYVRTDHSPLFFFCFVLLCYVITPLLGGEICLSTVCTAYTVGTNIHSMCF